MVNPNLDPDELVIGTEVELLITPPEGKEIDQLIINYENKTATIRNNKFTVRIERDLDIMIYFKQRYTSINLPEGVMLVNDSLDTNDLPVASNVALKVVEPSGKSLSSLKVNGEEIIDSLDEDKKFTVKVALNLTIEAIYSDTYHITYSINYGQFTITQEIAETTMVTEDFILEEAGDFDWKLNGEPFSFDRPFNYGRDITLTTIVEELPEENFTYDIVEGLAVIRSINNPENIKVIIIPDRLGEFFVGSTAHYDYSTSIFVRKNIVKYVKLPGLFQTLGDGAFVDNEARKAISTDYANAVMSGSRSNIQWANYTIEHPNSYWTKTFYPDSGTGDITNLFSYYIYGSGAAQYETTNDSIGLRIVLHG